MSVTVSCSSATFMRSASSRLVCATNESGWALSAARLSVDRAIDRLQAQRDFRGDGRIERAVSIDRQLLERGDGVLIVLLGELQLRRGVARQSWRPIRRRRCATSGRDRTTRRCPASSRAPRLPPAAPMTAEAIQPASPICPPKRRARRRTSGGSTFAAIAFHKSGEGVNRSSLDAAARISIKSFSRSRQLAHSRQCASTCACCSGESVPSTASPSHSVYCSQFIRLPSEAPAGEGGLCGPVISRCPR